MSRSVRPCQALVSGLMSAQATMGLSKTQAIGKTRDGFKTNIAIVVNDGGQLAD